MVTFKSGKKTISLFKYVKILDLYITIMPAFTTDTSMWEWEDIGSKKYS